MRRCSARSGAGVAGFSDAGGSRKADRSARPMRARCERAPGKLARQRAARAEVKRSVSWRLESWAAKSLSDWPCALARMPSSCCTETRSVAMAGNAMPRERRTPAQIRITLCLQKSVAEGIAKRVWSGGIAGCGLSALVPDHLMGAILCWLADSFTWNRRKAQASP